MSRLGIVVITYNSEAVIGDCIDACLASGACEAADIVVVDNASRDATLDVVRRRPVRLIANTRNLGFAGAANQGTAALVTQFVLLLNPDACIERGIGDLVEACCRTGAGAAGGRLIGGQDGASQSGFMVRSLPTAAALSFEAMGINRMWPGNAVNRRYRCMDLDENEPAEVDQPAGAFLLFRREAWQTVGGFDEEFYPLWFEDVDFCKRLKQAGWTVRYVPSAVARHRGGHSVDSLTWERRQIYWYSSLLRYASKHFRLRLLFGVCLAVMAGALPRLAAGVVSRASMRPFVVYARVVRLAIKCLISGKAGEIGRFPGVGPVVG